MENNESACLMLNPGDGLHGYRVLWVDPLPETQSVFHELVHPATGARHIHIRRPDRENTFGVIFKTVPRDSTGVAHILEHVVLCGSQRFPVRDLFFSKRLVRAAPDIQADPGLYPPGYHIGNIAYHLLMAWLVFLVVSRLAGNFRVALLAAGIFALHPVHTDSVTYLAGRRDILFTLFYLAGFYFFLRYRQEKRLSLMIFAFIMYMLSMGSKEMGVTLPALFCAMTWLRISPRKVSAREAVPGGFLRALKRVWPNQRISMFLFSSALLLSATIKFSLRHHPTRRLITETAVL